MYSRGLTRLLSARTRSLAAVLSRRTPGHSWPPSLATRATYATFEGGSTADDHGNDNRITPPPSSSDGPVTEAAVLSQDTTAAHDADPAAAYPSFNLPDPVHTSLATLATGALPVTSFQAALANVTSLTGVVQTVLQDSSFSNYSVTLHMGAPAFGMRTPQQIQVLLKGHTALQLAPLLRPGMVLHAVGALQSSSRSSLRLVASSLSEVSWDSMPAEIQHFYSLAAQEKPEKPKAKSTERPKKEPYGNQRQQYEVVLQYGSFEAAAQAAERLPKTVSNNVLDYVEATAPEYINWPAFLSAAGIAINDPDPVLPTVRELVDAVESFRPTALANPAMYTTKVGFMKLRPLLDHIKASPGSASLWRKFEPLAHNFELDKLYRILQVGRYIANTHLDPEWMATAVPLEPPLPDPSYAAEAAAAEVGYGPPIPPTPHPNSYQQPPLPPQQQQQQLPAQPSPVAAAGQAPPYTLSGYAPRQQQQQQQQPPAYPQHGLWQPLPRP